MTMYCIPLLYIRLIFSILCFVWPFSLLADYAGSLLARFCPQNWEYLMFPYIYYLMYFVRNIHNFLLINIINWFCCGKACLRIFITLHYHSDEIFEDNYLDRWNNYCTLTHLMKFAVLHAKWRQIYNFVYSTVITDICGWNLKSALKACRFVFSGA